MKIIQIAVTTIILTLSLGSASTYAQQFTEGFDPAADVCKFIASTSYFQRNEATAPEVWGALEIHWNQKTEEVTHYEWNKSSGTLYHSLDTTIGPSPRVSRDISKSNAWRFSAKLTPTRSNHAIAGVLHYLGGYKDPAWIFGGVLMQTGSRPISAHGIISCAYSS